MKLSDLLEHRSNENVIYDFSKLSRDELAVFVNSRIYGEESLSDGDMQLLESGTAKIVERAGTPRSTNNSAPPFDESKDDPKEWLRKRLTG